MDIHVYSDSVYNVYICIDDICNFYRESERQRVYLHDVHCLMDCANPALFETVPGIDDLQAFEELKEAWYN